MSDENVETVRRFFNALDRAFDAYWRDPRSIAAAMEAQDLWPEWRELFGYVHPQAEWRMAFLGETRRGHLDAAAGWDDFLAWAEDYRPRLEDVVDLGGEHVLLVVNLIGKDRASGVQIDARLFAVCTIRERLMVRVEEYTDLTQALESVGLSELDARYGLA